MQAGEISASNFNFLGQVENAEVRKRKYGNGNRSTEVRRKAANQCLVSYWLTNMCVEAL